MLGSTFVPLLLIRLHNTASTAAIFRPLCYRRHTKELKRVGEEREREKQRRCFRGQWHRRLLYSQHRVENTAVSVAEITVHEILILRFQMSHVVCCATYKEKNISAKCIKKKKKSKAHVVAQPIPKVSVSSLRLINITRHCIFDIQLKRSAKPRQQPLSVWGLLTSDSPSINEMHA